MKASELILNPKGSIYHLNLHPEQIAQTIITVGDPERVGEVSKYFDKLTEKVERREFVTHTGELAGKRLSVISTGIGTDNIDIVLNELDALVNIDLQKRTSKKQHTSLNIIRIGTSGSMQKDLDVDEFLFSSHALGLDGLGIFYDLENAEKTSKDLEDAGLKIPAYQAKGSEALIKKLAGNYRTGTTVTCAGFYAPQGRALRLKPTFEHIIQQLSKVNLPNLAPCTNFEMETAGIYLLSKLLGHQAVSCNAILANRIYNTFFQYT